MLALAGIAGMEIIGTITTGDGITGIEMAVNTLKYQNNSNYSYNPSRISPTYTNSVNRDRNFSSIIIRIT
jgi:hypothetical protein